MLFFVVKSELPMKSLSSIGIPAAGRFQLGTNESGFSLVEVVLAMGLVSFALVAILGLVPPGLSTFRKAIGTSVGSQIIQQVVADLQQVDFDTLNQSQPLRYFGDQGDELGSGAQPPSSPQNPVIYYVNIFVKTPVTLPGGDSSNLACVTIEVIRNPGNISLVRDANGSVQDDIAKGIFVSRYSAFIARSQ